MNVSEAVNNLNKTMNRLKEKIENSDLDENSKSEMIELIHLISQDFSNVNKAIAVALEMFAYKLR